jgi:Xaa-Pro aminopeptidase
MMKIDLDNLMEERGLDVLWVTGAAQHNPAMTYFTGLAHFTGDLIKKRNGETIVFCNPMEREEAAKSGLKTILQTKYSFKEALEKMDGQRAKANAYRFQQMLTDVGVDSGRMAIYGRTSVGPVFDIFSALQDLMPELEVTGDMGDAVLPAAMVTKDEVEMEQMRAISKINMEVVSRVQDFISRHTVKDEVLVKGDGTPLKIEEVKSKINLWLAELGAENPHGTIFAIGRDAGIPHSSGTPSDFLRLGQTIVFDIYPCQAGGGYHSDFTRTWCLGYASDEVFALYEDVFNVFKKIMDSLKIEDECPQVQQLTCDLFAEKGHATIDKDRTIQEGYVHSIGHGLGLNVHERPWFSSTAPTLDTLQPGMVFTVEPGLYYPSKGMGCRVEDAVYMNPEGSIEILTEYPYDLVVPVKG